MSEDVNAALEAATMARKNAYAPYSNFQVGAAFKVPGNDGYFTGFNIENAAYPSSMCAERTALYRMCTQTGKTHHPEYLVIVTDTDYALGPCGGCLQVLTEFCSPDMPIYLANLEGIKRQTTLGDLIQFDADKFSKTLQK